jgi:hypothetical protein
MHAESTLQNSETSPEFAFKNNIIPVRFFLRWKLIAAILTGTAAMANNNSEADNGAGGSPATQDMDTSAGLDLGNILRQCSLSRPSQLTLPLLKKGFVPRYR